MLPFIAVAAAWCCSGPQAPRWGVTFIVVATVDLHRLVGRQRGDGGRGASSFALLSFPTVFFAGFMLSEPLTLPPRRWQQLAEAVLVGVLFMVPFNILGVSLQPAARAGRRQPVRVLLRAASRHPAAATSASDARTDQLGVRLRSPRRPCGSRPGSTWSYAPARARPTPAAGAGCSASRRRRSRRDGAVRHPVPERVDVQEGAARTGARRGRRRRRSAATSCCRPDDPPLLLVAGGIGITPFIGQLEYCRRVASATSPSCTPRAPRVSSPTANSSRRGRPRRRSVAPRSPSGCRAGRGTGRDVHRHQLSRRFRMCSPPCVRLGPSGPRRRSGGPSANKACVTSTPTSSSVTKSRCSPGASRLALAIPEC